MGLEGSHRHRMALSLRVTRHNQMKSYDEAAGTVHEPACQHHVDAYRDLIQGKLARCLLTLFKSRICTVPLSIAMCDSITGCCQYSLLASFVKVHGEWLGH